MAEPDEEAKELLGGTTQKTMVGENYVIEAGTSITLKCGASSIHMNQAGIITINGTIISILGRANCNMSAPITNISGTILLTNTATVALTAAAVIHSEAAEIRSQAAKLNHMGSGEQVEVVASGNAVIKGAMVKLN